jgi:hypothetical protein
MSLLRSLFEFVRITVHGNKVGFLVVLLSCSLLPVAARGQAFSPYADFQGMTLNQLQTLQVKLTYVGPQQRAQPSIAFTSTSNKVDLASFVPFRRPGIEYTNDDINVQTFTAGVDALKALITDIGTLPNITAGGVAPSPFLSFALVNLGKGFEAVLSEADAASLFNQIRLALKDETVGASKLSNMSCSLNLIDPQRPVDVTSGVSVSLSGLRVDRRTGNFVASATLHNGSGSSIAGPISLIVVTSQNIQLANRTGTTCVTVPVGSGYIDAPLNENTLGVGGSIPMTLVFNNPDSKPLSPSTTVLAGPGAR